MARLKRSSQVLEKAERRCAGLKSISVTLDLGEGLTLAFSPEAPRHTCTQVGVGWIGGLL